MGDHHLLQPLITTTSTTSSDGDHDFTTTFSSNSIIIRFVSVIFVAIISIWANYEASKGFEITIINDASDILAGRRFNLLYVSNDKLTRIVLQTSEFAENILYPSSDESHRHSKKKPITHVTVKLAGRNLTHPVIVNSIANEEFVIYISPVLMGERNVDKAIVSAVQRGIARVWLWNEEYGAPQSLIDGIEEYVSISAGISDSVSDSGSIRPPESDGTCWRDKNPVAVANFLSYCEGIRSGFIGRLNQAMRDQWHDWTVDDALGMPAQKLCASYHSSTIVIL